MNILFDGIFSREPEYPVGEAVRRRIKAKVDFWSFMEESSEELIINFLEPDELAKEIINTALWMLHPHYEGPEIMEEARLILSSLKIPVPGAYEHLFYISFKGIISKKLKGALNRKKNSGKGQ